MQEDYTFKVSLVYTARLCLFHTTKQTNKNQYLFMKTMQSSAKELLCGFHCCIRRPEYVQATERLASSVLHCVESIWLDPSKTNEIANANSQQIRKLIKDRLIIRSL